MRFPEFCFAKDGLDAWMNLVWYWDTRFEGCRGMHSILYLGEIVDRTYSPGGAHSTGL